MNESLFESFPNDVMVTELSRSHGTGCESQRELSYSHLIYTVLPGLYVEFWCWRLAPVKNNNSAD